MIVKKIHYSQKFAKELRKMHGNIINLAVKKEQIFKENPLHHLLCLHELHGKFKGIWSISITGNYRIIFKRMDNGDILFISIGKHDIYNCL